MGATGTASINFGSFPGTDQASVVVTGQGAILSSSRVEAWLDPTQGATADHSVGEIESVDFDVRCETIVGGTGFTIIVTTRGGFQYGAYPLAWVWV